MTPEDVKDKIKSFLAKPKWDTRTVDEVESFLALFSPHPSLSMCAVDVVHVERLRETLCSILDNFDILITEDKIILQERKPESWWHRNYGWILGVITAIFTAIGVFLKLLGY